MKHNLFKVHIAGLIPCCLYGCRKFHGSKSHVDFIYGSFNSGLFKFISLLFYHNGVRDIKQGS